MNGLKQHSNIFLLSIYLSIYTLSIIVFTMQYEVNDDVVMQLIASGKYTGTPNPHLVFSNIIIGYLLNFFYRVQPQLNWYTVYLFSIHFISSLLIFISITSKDQSIIEKVLSGLVVLSISILLLIKLQFTTTSGIAFIAGFSIINKNLYCQISAVLLMIISFMIRDQMFFYLTFLSLPILVLRFRPSLSQRKVIFMTLLGCGIVYLVNLEGYKDKEWNRYQKYNTIRGSIHDNPHLSEFVKINSSGNQSATLNDLRMLQSFFFDNSILDINALTSINDTIQDNKFRYARLENLKKSLLWYKKELIILSFMLLFHLLNRSKQDYAVIISFLLFFAIWFHFGLFGNFKERVFYSGAFYLATISIFFGSQKINGVKRMIFYLPFIMFFFYRCYTTSNHYFKKKDVLETQMNQISTYDYDKIIPVALGLKLECFNPWSNPNFIETKALELNGWMAGFPSNESFSELFDSANVFVVSQQTNHIEMLNQYCQDRGIDGKFFPIDTIYNQFSINNSVILKLKD